MGQAPRELMPSRSPADFFGAELRHWREARGLSQDQLGRQTLNSGSTIGKVEKAIRRPSFELARKCDEILQTGGALTRLMELVEADAEPSDGSELRATAIASASDDVGLRWSPDLATTVETVGRLWKADVERRAVVVGAAWSAAAFGAPARDWLLSWTEPDPIHIEGHRIGAAEVDAVWSMCRTFTDLDHMLGGGHARSTLAHYLSTAVLPMLKGSYGERTGRRLLAAAARLCDIAGFMAFDCRLHGLAQRYYIQALRLAKASGKRGLGSHILADMSMQAHYVGDGSEALALARAGQRTAQDCGSPALLARCCALEARAHALLGDGAACGQAMAQAERTLDVDEGDDPSWVSFFTHEQLAAEFMYAASDLGRSADVQRFAPAVLAPSSGMQRRMALATAALASSHLAGADESAIDVDQACAVLRTAVPVAASLSSPRTTGVVNAVRARLRVHADRPAVQQLEDEIGVLLGAAS
jgi:transcriptional regulator with XRE-family HTH domain